MGINEYNHLLSHKQAVLAIAFTQEGESLETFLSASKDRTIKRWNREGQLLRTLIHNDTLQAVGFSPDSEMFAVGELSAELLLGKRDKFCLSHLKMK